MGNETTKSKRMPRAAPRTAATPSRGRYFAWLLVVLPCLLLVAPVLSQDRSFAFRDTAHFYYPLFEWIEQEASQRELPLWNPHVNYGTSLVGEGTSSMFYPGRLLFCLPLEFSWRMKLYIVGHLLFTAVSGYWAARRFGASREAATLAGMAFSCGGSVLFQYCNVVYLVSAAWLPVAFVAVESMLRRQSWRAAIGLGITLAMMTLGGDPQMAYHVGFAAACYALALWWEDRSSTSQNESAIRSFSLLHYGSLLTLAALSAGILSAIQVLPSAETSREADRTAYHAPRNIYEAAPLAWQGAEGRALASEGLFRENQSDTHAASIYLFAFAPWHLLEYVWPQFGGSYFPTNCRWLGIIPYEPRMWNQSVYFGLLPFVLAVAALRLRSGSVREQWLSWCAVLAVLGSFGPFGPVWLMGQIALWLGFTNVAATLPDPRVGGVYWFFVTFLPGYAYFRFPAKLLTFAAWPLCLLAAMQFDQYRVREAPRIRWCFGICLLFSLLAAITLLFAGSQWQRFTEGIPPETTYGPFDVLGSRYELIRTLCHTAIVCGLAWLLLKQPFAAPPIWRRWGLVLLTGVELIFANGAMVATAPANDLRTQPLLGEIIAQDRAARGLEIAPRVRPFAMPDVTDPTGFALVSSPDRVAEMNRFEVHLAATNHCLSAGIDCVDALTSQRSADYTYWFKRYHKNEEAYWGNYWIMSRNHPLDYMPEWSELPHEAFTRITQCRVYRHCDPFPRAWLIHEVTLLPELHSHDPFLLNDRSRVVVGEAVGLASQRRDLRREAVVESDVPLTHEPEALFAEQREEEKCSIVSEAPNRVVIEVKLAAPGLLVLGDMFAPGWEAWRTSSFAKNSERVPIVRTNRCFRGVALPVGEQRIEFRFNPVSLYRGAWLSLFGWCLVLVGAVADLRVWRDKLQWAVTNH